MFSDKPSGKLVVGFTSAWRKADDGLLELYSPCCLSTFLIASGILDRKLNS